MNSARATPLPPGQSLLDGAAYDEGAAAADFQVGKPPKCHMKLKKNAMFLTLSVRLLNGVMGDRTIRVAQALLNKHVTQ